MCPPDIGVFLKVPHGVRTPASVDKLCPISKDVLVNPLNTYLFNSVGPLDQWQEHQLGP